MESGFAEYAAHPHPLWVGEVKVVARLLPMLQGRTSVDNTPVYGYVGTVLYRILSLSHADMLGPSCICDTQVKRRKRRSGE